MQCRRRRAPLRRGPDTWMLQPCHLFTWFISKNGTRTVASALGSSLLEANQCQANLAEVDLGTSSGCDRMKGRRAKYRVFDHDFLVGRPCQCQCESLSRFGVVLQSSLLYQSSASSKTISNSFLIEGHLTSTGKEELNTEGYELRRECVRLNQR